MNGEQNICGFCRENKEVSRYYVLVKNRHFDDNKKGSYGNFFYYCNDCGIADPNISKSDEKSVEVSNVSQENDKGDIWEEFETLIPFYSDREMSLMDMSNKIMAINHNNKKYQLKDWITQNFISKKEFTKLIEEFEEKK